MLVFEGLGGVFDCFGVFWSWLAAETAWKRYEIILMFILIVYEHCLELGNEL